MRKIPDRRRAGGMSGLPQGEADPAGIRTIQDNAQARIRPHSNHASAIVTPREQWRYTADEMVELAQREGCRRATKPTLYDWMRLGLMGKPEDWGEVGLWTASQFSLWLLLLRKRDQERVPLRGLVNLVVAGWLYFGEDLGGVLLPQVQRAMKTWALQSRYSSLEATRRAAQHLVTIAKTRDAQQVRAAKHKLNKLLQGNQLLTAEGARELRDVFSSLLEGRRPKRQGRVKGPAGAGLSVESMTDLLLTRARALERLCSQPDAYADWMWDWVRATLLWGLQEYKQKQPFYAQETRRFRGLEEWYLPETLETLVPNACVHLLTALGVACEDANNTQYNPRLPEPLQLDAWRGGGFTMQMNTQIVAGLQGTPTTLQGEIVVQRRDTT